MDWLKKYYEKILLAVALLLLILVAAGLVFKINSITTALHLPQPGDKPLAAIDLGPYSNAMANLKSPPRWTNPSVAALFPPRAFKVIQAPEWKNPFTLESVVRRPFVLRFLAYNQLSTNNFQVNFLAEDQRTVLRSFFIDKVGMEIADRFGKTGYFATKYEHKIEKVQRSGITLSEDRSELTVQHEGEDPIVLVLTRPTTYPKRYARIQCLDKAEPLEVPAGETFEYQNRIYKVIDISDKEVIIEDSKSKKKLPVRPSSVEPERPPQPGADEKKTDLQ
jgi:hypothetical protein